MTSGLWLASGIVIVVLGAIYYFGRQMVKASQARALEDENELRERARKARHGLRGSDAELDRLRGGK